MDTKDSFLSRLWRSRWVRGVIWPGAGLLALYVGLTIWLNHHGSRAWKAAEERLTREGVTLDFTAVDVKPIPAAENFCAIPLLTGINQFVDGDETKGEPAARRKALHELGPPPFKDGFPRPNVTNQENEWAPADLKAWAEWLRDVGHPMPVTDAGNPAREVLAALSYQDAAVAEMAAVVDRPVARLQPDWRAGPLPELLVARSTATLTTLQNLSLGLALRAKAAAQAGDAVRAHEAALILARITESTLEEPFALGLLVGITNAAQLCRVVCEFGHFHCGSAEDFGRLREAMERVNFRLATLRAYKEEVAVGVNACLYMERNRQHATPWWDGEEFAPALRWTGWLIPRGWFESNAAALTNLTLDHMILPVRDRGWVDAMAAQQRLETHLEEGRRKIWTNLDQFMALLAMPASSTILERTAYAQCLWDQAIIVCALEQYLKERGSYPDDLGILVASGEKALPLDIFSGGPMGYRKTVDGRYVLWGVGFDGINDNGHRPEKTWGKPRVSSSSYKGDWVWEFAKPEEAESQTEEKEPLKRLRKRKPAPRHGRENLGPSAN